MRNACRILMRASGQAFLHKIRESNQVLIWH